MVQLSRRALLAGLMLPVAGCIKSRPALAVREPIDLMPQFWQAFDAAKGQPLEQRVSVLVKRFFQPNEATYSLAGTTIKAERIARWLPEFDGMAMTVRALHRRFVSDFASYVRAFSLSFPDFDPGGAPVYLLPSLFSFDAHLEPDGHSLPLFFGLDGIVKYHGDATDLSVLFAHELFHCYHGQRRPDILLDNKPPLYVNLWIEGLATYVSERLNPRAALVNVLLDDRELLQRGPAVAAAVALSMLLQLDSTVENAGAVYFSSEATGDWPARSGYYVGLLAARIMGQHRTLAQMASLPPAQVRTDMEVALRRISEA